MYKTIVFCVALSSLIFLTFLSYGQEGNSNSPILTVYTINLPPFVHSSNEGEVKGIYADKAVNFLNSKNLEYKIYFTKWHAAYTRAMGRSNLLIFPIARIPSREDQFHWLSKLDEIPYYLYSKSGLNLENLSKEEILEGDYQIACARDTIQCAIAENYGFPKDRIITDSEMEVETRYKVIINNRVEFSIFNPDILKATANKEQFNPKEVIKSKFLGKIGLYIAIGKKVDTSVLNKLNETPK